MISIHVCIENLQRRLRSRKQFGEIIVDARHAEVRLALEGLSDVLDRLINSVYAIDFKHKW
jgi:hypothetical protein